MKKIGLIGGISWQSTLSYYRYLNEMVGERLGASHSAECIIYSVQFAEIHRLQKENDWKALDKLMATAAKNLEASGAEIILIGANTMHLCREAILENTNLDCLHIAEVTAKEIKKKNIQKVGLLGTKFTMQKDFYKKVLNDDFEIEVVVQSLEDQVPIHSIIYDELIYGTITDASREIYKKVISNLESQGAEGVILGCTEIPLLISDSDVNIPTFNTTKIHVQHAVNWALS